MAIVRDLWPLLGAMALVLGACGGQTDRPNLLLITVDTLRADHLEAYGDAAVDTPALDAFLAEAVVFEHAWTVIPITTPSLGTLLTSRMPRNHGALNNAYDLTAPDPTLAMALSEEGWNTAAFLPTFLADKAGFRRGFARYEHPSMHQQPWTGEEVVGRALSFLDEVEPEGEPWFLWVHLIEPHSPYDPGPELEAKYLPEGARVTRDMRFETFGEGLAREPGSVELLRGLYRGEVERTDRCLEPLLARVRAAEAPVLTVFTADHGEMLYEEHDYVGHTAWLREPTLAIPLAFHANDGRLSPERRSDPVTLLDVAPTLLGLVHLSWTSLDGGVDLFEDRADPQRLIVHETYAPEAFRDKVAVRRGAHFLEGIREGDPGAAPPADPGSWTWPGLADDPRGDARDLEDAYRAWSAKQLDPRSHARAEVDAATRRALEKMGYAQGAGD